MNSEDTIIAVIREEFRGLLDPGAFDLADDCALLAHGGLVTTDVVVEGVDFDRALYPVVYAGYRALAQNLSDIAAGGGTPTSFLWSLAIPSSWPLDDVREFARGAAILSKLRGVKLLGGDLSSTSGPMVCTIAAFGRGRPLLRSTARVGDGLYLTSTVGASAAGLRRLRRGDAPKSRAQFEDWLRSLDDNDARAVRAHVKPLPAEIAPLANWPTAAIDVSDGLLRDAHRLAKASRVALDLDKLEDAIDPAATIDDALGGGEDYALLFTAPMLEPAPADAIRIGRVVEGKGVWSNGMELSAQGYEHFPS